MSQLTFTFPFKKKYYEQDFYVSSNNFSAYRLIENWPNWPGKWVNIYGPRGCGKTHLSNILKIDLKKEYANVFRWQMELEKRTSNPINNLM